MIKPFHFILAAAITVPLFVLYSGKTESQNATPKNNLHVIHNESDAPVIFKSTQGASITDAPYILQLKVLGQFPGYSDLSKVENCVKCKVISILKGDGFQVGDTIAFGQTEYFTKDDAYTIRNKERVKTGKEYIVYLRKRGKDEITWSDSCFQHYLHVYTTFYSNLVNANVTAENTEDYVMTKMFIEEFDSLKYSYHQKW